MNQTRVTTAAGPAPERLVETGSTRQVHRRGLRTVAATTAVGLALGFAIGGVGGRLAMRALFLTSDPSVRGIISDDGFPIGRFDVMATLNLLLVGTVVGVIGAFVYLAVRPFLLGPRWLRQATCMLAAGAVVGSMIVHVDGVDFTRLGPTWFAIALFVALPALFGLVAPPAIEWAARPDGWFQSASHRGTLAPLLVFLFPPLLVLVGLPTAAVIGAQHASDRSASFSQVLHHPVTIWTARAGWLAVAVVGVVALARDTIALL